MAVHQRYFALYKEGKLTQMAKELFKEERKFDRLDGWFLAKETEMQWDEKYKDEPLEI